MINLKITLSFRNQDSRREITVGNLTTNEYEDFDYYTFLYSVNENTTVKAIYEYAIEIISGFDKNFIKNYVIFYPDIMFMFFLQDNSGKVSEIVENPDTKILNVLKYLKIRRNFKLFNCAYGVGGMWKQLDGVKFFTHSNEENHKYTPHIHTIYDNKNASYSIINGEKIAGDDYPSKIEKNIKKIIMHNTDQLLKFWEDTTNGIYHPCTPFQINKF